MDRFKSVLYLAHPFPGSSRGFSCAVEVARLHGARLTLAAVVSDCTEESDGRALSAGADQRREALLRRCRARLQRLATQGRAAGVDVQIRVLGREPAEAALAELTRGRHDLLVKVAESGGFLWPWRLHPTDRRILRRSPCPVWMLAPAQGPGVRVVMAAVDVGPGRAPDLSARVVRTAASVAGLEAEVHVVHAWSIVGEPILASAMTGLSRPRMRSLLAGTRRERRRRLQRLLARETPDRTVRVAMPKGDPVRAIRQEARWREADVVVVGNSRRTGLEGLLLGNVAERLVGRVPGSVLAVAPGTPEAPPAGAEVEKRHARVPAGVTGWGA